MSSQGGVFAANALAEFVETLPLVDHHVHGAYRSDGDQARFGNALNEADTAPLADPTSAYDSQLGFAVRRWCAPLLDLPRNAEMADYWSRRSELGEAEVNARLLRAARVSDWLLDTGFGSADLLGPAELAEASSAGQRAEDASHGFEIVRLETLAESVIGSVADPVDYPDAFAEALQRAAAREGVVGTKTVLAYRAGFDHDLARPAGADLMTAVRDWTEVIESSSEPPRLVDPTVIAFGIHAALEQRLPVQFHVGFGDRDLDLLRVNPLLLTDFLRSPEASRAPILLLHCYPYEREAGYLAQAFAQVHLDVGLATHFLGARSTDLVARSLELAPFGKILYSSDAAGPAELHYLGSRLWRNAIGEVFGGWVAADEWTEADARRVATKIASENARRVYRLK